MERGRTAAVSAVRLVHLAVASQKRFVHGLGVLRKSLDLLIAFKRVLGTQDAPALVVVEDRGRRQEVVGGDLK